MQAVAHAHFARYSYRKVNQVLKLLRGKSAVEAIGMLPWIPRTSRVLVEKVLKSAVANAGRKANPAGLYVTEAWANHGPTLKRVMPKAMGARAMFKRKMCHVTITVSDVKGKK